MVGGALVLRHRMWVEPFLSRIPKAGHTQVTLCSVALDIGIKELKWFAEKQRTLTSSRGRSSPKTASLVIVRGRALAAPSHSRAARGLERAMDLRSHKHTESGR